MKVAIVTPYFYPHPGGVEVYTYNMARKLRAQGWDVVIITSSDRPGRMTKSMQDGLQIYRLGYRWKLSNTPWSLGWRRHIKRILATEKPDVINAHTPVPVMADIAERVRGTIPFVLTYHNDLAKDGFWVGLAATCAHTLLTRRTLKRAQHIIATSGSYAQSSKALRRHLSKVSIVPPGVDTDRFNTAARGGAIRKQFPGKQLILYSGAVSMAQQHKGIEVLIDAFAIVRRKLPNTHLILAGRGDGQPFYEAAAHRAGVLRDVTFTGYLTDDEQPAYYTAASVSVLPSTNRSEGFGMVLTEAGACGTPVVGTNIGGITAAVHDGKTGIIVPPKDPKALAKAMLKILGNATFAKQLGKQGAVQAATYSWDALAAQTATAFTQAMKPTIVHVAGYYPPHLGGMEKVAKELAEGTAARGYMVQVLTSTIPSAAASAPVANLTIKRCKAFEFAHTPFAFGFIWAMAHIPKHSVVHLHIAQAFYPEVMWVVCKVRRIPYVAHFHLDLMPSGPLGWLFVVYKALVIRTVIRQAARVAVFTAAQQAFIHQTYGVPKARVAVIPNGVDESFFAKPRLAKSRKTLHILYAGRLSDQKRVDRLVGAMAHLKAKAHLTIVGDGETRAALEKQAHGAKNISFAGYKTPTELQGYFAKSDIFAIASSREGMPLVVLEAMAGGLPIVGSDVTGTHELLHGVGVLVADPSPKAFAAAIDTLAAHPQQLAKASKQSVAAARKYRWPLVVDAFEALYTEVTP